MSLDFRNTFSKSFFTSGMYIYMQQGLAFLSTIIVSRFVSPKEYGIIAIVTVFMGFLLEISNNGLSYHIIREDLKKEDKQKVHSLSLLSGTFFMIMMMIISLLISIFYDNSALFPVGILLSTIFLFNSLITVPRAALHKKLNFATDGKIRTLSEVLGTSVTVALAILGFSFWSLVWGRLSNYLLQTLLYQLNDFNKIILLNKKEFTQTFSEVRSIAKNITGTNLLRYFGTRTDDLVVGKTMGPENLGLVNRAFNLINLPSIAIMSIFNQIMLPNFKSIKDESSQNQKYRALLGILAIINFPTYMPFILFPETTITFLYGADWIEVASLTPYLAAMGITRNLLSTSSNILILRLKENILWSITLVTIGTMLPMGIIGAFISLKHVVFLKAMSYLLLVAPFTLYVALYKRLLLQDRFLLLFFLPKLSLSAAVCLFFFFGMPLLGKISFLLLGVTILIQEYKRINQIGTMIIGLSAKLKGNAKEKPHSSINP